MKYCPQCKQQFSDDQQRFCPRDQVRLSLPDPYRLVGSTLENKYQIEALAGIGGFGAVYSAQHTGLARQVAFKILKPDIAVQTPHAVTLFAEEAKTVGRLRHENIVEVFDTGRTADGLAYLAMEWLDGVALDEELRARGPLSVAYTAELLRQIAAALAKAHAQRIIHRDLKPSNVMLVRQPGEPERLKVLDFGIAKVLSADAGSLAVSQVSRPIGTPHYSSPEQWQTKAEIDARSDIYALGVMLYEMLSGAMPFNASSIPELIQLKLNTRPRPLRELRPEIPAALDELVRRMFERDKEQRPRHVWEIPALFEVASKPAALPLPVPLQAFEFVMVTVDERGNVIQRRDGRARQTVEDLGGVKLEMVEIPAGEFQMGSNKYYDEEPIHKVRVKGFLIGKYAVTQGQWRAVAGFPKVKLDLDPDPARFKGADLPVEQVSWEEAVEFCARLSRKTGKTYRLPSEAEWEYAARAGTTTPFAFGPTITPELVNYNGNRPYGSAPKGQYRGQMVPVGSLGVANAFGLHDMHGNVWEWCEDDWHGNYKGAPTDGRAWADIPAPWAPRAWVDIFADGAHRTLRGGCWNDSASQCRSANRHHGAPGFRYARVGFRLVRT